MINNLTIGDLMIDCANAERARDFYANLMGWKKTVAYNCLALKTDNGLTILFAETDIPYVPPVWPEEPGEQQKQMHLDFTVDDVQFAMYEAIRLGATKAATQYGGETCITMLDTEGHPFCLCQRSQNKSEFDIYFEKKGYGKIPDISINIDCEKQQPLRGFYAELTGWDQDFHWSALVADNGMIVCFQGCDNDATMDNYVPPIWPEEPGNQQKQMHFNFQVDDLTVAVEEAIKFGARKAAEQYGGEHFVTMIDPEGHPFCLCQK
jgi:catechol 2,3-dioxygenase-like lactoylglutathione lyase family enzyme